MLVDSHCHLDRLDLSHHGGELANALNAAKAQGVKHFLCVCIDLENFKTVLNIAENYADVSASVGLHPTEPVPHEPTMAELIKLGSHPKIIAVGETGLDYFHCKGDIEWQRERFRTHIRAAIELNKPLIIHSRDAREDTIKILRQENAQVTKGVMHCFTENWEMAQQAMELGFYISFSGIVTFKNATSLKEVAQLVPLERILIETDAPYLAPMPYRGKPNEPAYVRYTAECIAELKGVSYEMVAKQTTQNFCDLFRVKCSFLEKVQVGEK